MQAGSEKNIGIEIKPSQPKNSQIAKEIVFLNPEGETIENLPIFGEFVFNEGNDIIVIEKSVFEIRIQALQAGRRRPLGKRQMPTFTRSG